MKNAIKGLAIASLVEDVRQRIRSGDLPESEIGKRLAPEDLAVLDEALDPFGWYPIACYERLTEALRAWTPGADEAWLRERGAAAARRLLERGLYQQLDALRQGRRAWTPETYLSRVRLIATLHGSLLSFSKWSVERDPDHERRVRIVIAEAGDFPEVLRHVTEGFMNACVDAAGGAHGWRSERIARDRIVIRMDADANV